MEPLEVRDRVLADHVRLRAALTHLSDLAVLVIGGDREHIEALRLETEKLLERFREHMSWEERFLAPLLRWADGAGELRVERMLNDHREQRALFDDFLHRVQDPGRPVELLARNLQDLIELMFVDMDEEENEMLDERLLTPR